MVRNWFKSKFVIFSIFTEMFVKAVCKFPACFSYADLLAKCTGYLDENRDDSSHCRNLNHHELVSYNIFVFHSPADAQNFRHRGDYETFTQLYSLPKRVHVPVLFMSINAVVWKNFLAFYY